MKKQTEMQEDQLDQQEQQMEMQEVDLNADGEVSPEEALAIQAMQKSIPASQRKFKGRTGGVTPNWADKHPDEERDIDEYAEARANKNELTLSKTWIESLNEKGFGAPIIKQVSDDLSQMWFSENNVDYVAELSANGVTTVSKAVFGDATRFSRYKQEGRKATKPTEIDIEDE